MLGAVCCNIFQGNKFRISFLKNFFYTDICKWFMSVHPEYMSEYLCKKFVTVSRKLRWILAAAADQVSGQGLIQVKTFCCDKYKNCEVYQMLKQIYEDDDNG